MKIAETEEVTDGYVFAALGLLGGARALDNWLEIASADLAPDPLEPEDPVLLAAVGLVSLRRTALRWLAEVAGLPDTPRSERSPLLRDLLR